MKKINLTIPEPCHENWDKMQKEEKGKFCNACQKTVVDFTNMSDRQLAEFFKRPSTSVCGRFQQDQLNRDLSMPRKRLPWLKYFFQFTLPAFLISVKANAQGKVKVIGDTTVQNCERPAINETPAKSLDERIEIKGRITDEHGEPLASATVIIKETMQGTMADKKGEFTLKVKKGATLLISYVGMETKQVIAEDSSAKNIVLVEMNTIMLGFVVTATLEPKPLKKHPIIPKIFDSAFTRFSVYPNPVRSGQQFTTETKTLEQGEYLVEIIHLNGEVIQTSDITISKQNKNFNTILKQIGTGVYFMRLTNKKSGKTYSEKLIVE